MLAPHDARFDNQLSAILPRLWGYFRVRGPNQVTSKSLKWYMQCLCLAFSTPAKSTGAKYAVLPVDRSHPQPPPPVFAKVRGPGQKKRR